MGTLLLFALSWEAPWMPPQPLAAPQVRAASRPLLLSETRGSARIPSAGSASSAPSRCAGEVEAQRGQGTGVMQGFPAKPCR